MKGCCCIQKTTRKRDERRRGTKKMWKVNQKGHFYTSNTIIMLIIMLLMMIKCRVDIHVPIDNFVGSSRSPMSFICGDKLLFECFVRFVEKSAAVTCGGCERTSKLLLLPPGPLPGPPVWSPRWRFIPNSSEWLELFRSRRMAAAAAARLSNWFTVAPECAKHAKIKIV